MIASKHLWLALAAVALAAAACGGDTTSSSDGGPDAAHDASGDAADAGPRVRDVCHYNGPDADHSYPQYPYLYTCKKWLEDPDCGGGSYLGPCACWTYYCAYPP